MSRVVSVGVESDAVVIDDKLDLVAFRHQMQSYEMGQGVFHDVLQRLLGNPVERFFCREVYLGFRFGHELDVELVPCSDGRGEATQPGDNNYDAAIPVQRSVVVLDASQSALNRFVAFSTDATWLHTGTVVVSGDIGANRISRSVSLRRRGTGGVLGIGGHHA